MIFRVCAREERLPVQLSVVTTFTALAALKVVPAVNVIVGLEVPFHVAFSV